MIVEFSVYDTNSYTIEHLLDSKENAELIEQFEVGKNAKGLENYLKYVSSDDEENNFSRTYLVKDKTTKEIASYFSIRTGLITMQVQDEKFDSIPAIELSNFAVNQNYRKNHPDVDKLGTYTFEYFVLPISRCLAKYIGIHALYIYALPNDKLIEHYSKMGFSRLSPEQEQFVQFHVKPKYDDGCIFMYQIL